MAVVLLTKKIELSEICHVNSNMDEDTFVGVKLSNGIPNVSFPLGYNLSDDEKGIRQDILQLISILKNLADPTEMLFLSNDLPNNNKNNFPISAYLNILQYYLNYGFYFETAVYYKTSNQGKINWSRTFKIQKPIVQRNGVFVYSKMTVKSNRPIEDKLITQINKYCVYESFIKIGWLFGINRIQNPGLIFNPRLFIVALNEKVADTNNDELKVLFKSMIQMIRYISQNPNESIITFGTNRFEYVWEKMIDTVFGVANKIEYFPRAEWQLRFGKNKSTSALMPDTVMIINKKVYVLDAKYYKYGVSGIPSNLPNSSSINKQITYGEFIEKHKKVEGQNVYNAFLMPFNSQNNMFSFNNKFGNVGQAIGKWKNPNSKKNYNYVQGVVIDVKYLMQCGLSKSSENMQYLAETIEEGITKYIVENKETHVKP